MKNLLTKGGQYLLLAILFVVMVSLNNHLLRSLRWDLTADQVYSLSAGSRDIVSGLQEPIELHFFFSETTSEGLTTLRNYAARVLSLIKEYQSISNGKISVKVIDPEPFSEAEDSASEYGLTAAVMPNTNDPIYFGLAAENAAGERHSIGFFDPQKEAFLEHELSELVYQLSAPTPVKVGVLTGLRVGGGQNPMAGNFEPPWRVYSQLDTLYELVQLPEELPAIPPEVNILLLIQPAQLSEQTLFAIDQFALGGGNIIAFVDPHHESDPMAAMTTADAPAQAELVSLLAAWGIQATADEVVLDVANALEIRTQQGVSKHPGFLGLPQTAMASDDLVTASLDLVNGASFGHLALTSTSKLQLQPLLQSSEYSNLIPAADYASSLDPKPLFAAIAPPQTSYVLAGRFSGEATSAFSEPPEGVVAEDFTPLTQGNIQAVVVADADMLTDRFWVSRNRFFGEFIYNAFADNGALVLNAVDNLAGSDALISIRSRGTFARPFTRVEELTAAAELRFLEQEQLLEQELLDIEQALAELQSQRSDDDTAVLTAEQQQALAGFNDKRLQVRKALRNVRHQLDKDIAQLGTQLKFINIALTPLILVLLLAWLMRVLRLRADWQTNP